MTIDEREREEAQLQIFRAEKFHTMAEGILRESADR